MTNQMQINRFKMIFCGEILWTIMFKNLLFSFIFGSGVFFFYIDYLSWTFLDTWTPFMYKNSNVKKIGKNSPRYPINKTQINWREKSLFIKNKFLNVFGLYKSPKLSQILSIRGKVPTDFYTAVNEKKLFGSIFFLRFFFRFFNCVRKRKNSHTRRRRRWRLKMSVTRMSL